MNLPNSSILRMNDADTLRFVNLYETEPVLWNTTLTKYKNREARAAAVQRIAKAVNLKDFGPQHVLMKFKNLRSSYCQELKKIAADDGYVPKVVWFSKMNSFLQPFVQSRAAQSNMTLYPERNDSSSENSENTQLDLSAFKRNPSTTTPIREPHRPHQNIEKPSKRSFVETPQAFPVAANKLIKTEDNLEDEVDVNHSFATEKLDELADEAQQLAENREDTFDHFGRYVASLLRNLPTDTALHLQQEIINLVLNAHIYSSTH